MLLRTHFDSEEFQPFPATQMNQPLYTSMQTNKANGISPEKRRIVIVAVLLTIKAVKIVKPFLCWHIRCVYKPCRAYIQERQGLEHNAKHSPPTHSVPTSRSAQWSSQHRGEGWPQCSRSPGPGHFASRCSGQCVDQSSTPHESE